MTYQQLIAAIALLMGALSADIHAAETGQAAPSFSLPSLSQNQPTSLSQFNGKVVYLDFWASWCAPCRTSFPLLNKLQQKLKGQGFEVVAVNLDEDKENADKFLREIPVEFTVLRDATGELSDQYGVESMPTSFIIDRQGVIRKIHHGFTSDDIHDIETKVVELLSNPK